MTVLGGRDIIKNKEKLVRPFESVHFSANFNFSHGHFLKNAGYQVPSGNGNIFTHEEPYQTYRAWKAGYTLYNPIESVVWHLWDRSYRHKFYEDSRKFSKEKMKRLASNDELLYGDNKVQGDIIRKIMFADKDYRQYMDEKWGIDLLGH